MENGRFLRSFPALTVPDYCPSFPFSYDSSPVPFAQALAHTQAADAAQDSSFGASKNAKGKSESPEISDMLTTSLFRMGAWGDPVGGSVRGGVA